LYWEESSYRFEQLALGALPAARMGTKLDEPLFGSAALA
jgi:hypothetical protein